MKTNLPNLRKSFIALILVAGCINENLTAQTYSFTPCGAIGRNGPTPLQVSTAYQSTNLNGLVTVLNGMQSWTVPLTGNYKIEAFGAQGGGAAGGLGAMMSGDFFLNTGTVLNLIAGQQGTVVGAVITDGASGGGGSYVVNSAGNVPLVVAGGGGGNNGTASVVCNGTIALPGYDGFGAQAFGTGGASGMGGLGINNGTGGGGFSGNGGGATNGGTHIGGLSFLGGGQGGYSSNVTYPWADGGFGGGGTAVNTGWRGAGGGGGYSGGGSGNIGSVSNAIGGGGGGSYNAGTNQVNTSGSNSGDGKIIITKLCNITLTATGTSANGALCSGNSVTLTTNAVSNYSWNTGATTSSIIVSPASTTSYTLTGTGPASCSGIAVITVSVQTGAPSLTVTNSANAGGVCPSGTVMLTANGASSYTWAGVSTVTNGLAFSPSAGGIYTVTGANACTTSSAVTSVSIHPLPTINALASSASLCPGATLTLNVSGSALTHTWIGGYTTGTGFPVTATSSYSVIGTGALSCTALATVATTVNPVPSLTITPSVPSGSICAGKQITLTASGGVNYTWTAVNTNSNGATITVSPTVAIVYNLTGDNIYNCTSNMQQTILVYPNPTIAISVTRPLVCTGGLSTLIAQGANTYTWGENAGGVNTPTTVVTPTNTSSGPVTYTVSGSYSTTGCMSSATVNVNVYVPVLTVSGSTIACYGANLNLVTGGGITYSWSPGITPTFTAGPLTVYTISAMSLSAGVSCLGTKTIAVEAYSVPVISASASRDQICKKERVILNAGGALSYLWSNSQSVGTITVSPSNTITYTVTGTDGNNCSGTATVAVKVLECTGIDELQSANKVLIYPNPNNGQFIIKSDSDLGLTIRNELGQVIKLIDLSGSNEYKISIESLAQGIYFVTGDGVNQKIIVTK